MPIAPISSASTGTCTTLTRGYSRASGSGSAWSPPIRERSAAPDRTSSTCWRVPGRRRCRVARTPGPRHAPTETMRKVDTPGKTRCEEVAAHLGIPLERMVKAIAIVRQSIPYGDPGSFALVLLRGDHDLNELKTQQALGSFRFASDKEIEQDLRCRPGYIGPVKAAGPVAIFADRTVAKMSDFVCGANEPGYHLAGVDWGRDLREDPGNVRDFRNVRSGDPSPDGKGTLHVARGIEVGHIFQLRTKYSEAMKAVYLDEKGESRPMEMGCHGIGGTRLVAAGIEQKHAQS